VARTKDQRIAAEQARELARAPVSDPYRGQLADPFADQRVPAGTLLAAPGGRAQIAPGSSGGDGAPAGGFGLGSGAPPTFSGGYDVTGQPIRPRAPGLAVAVGVLALLEGVVIGVLGLLLIALISISHNIDVGDRSFYAGQDASYILLGVLNLGVSAALVVGAVALMTGRLSGRIALTAGAWTVLGFSAFWGTQDNVSGYIPFVLALVAAAILALGYQRSLTDWLGVLPPPQPE
jgi:hypothetical protein